MNSRRAVRFWRRASLAAAALVLGSGLACSGSPTFPAPNAPLEAVTAGAFHTCALDGGGRAFCWGANGHGQLGLDSGVELVASPAAVAGEFRFRSLSAGATHTCGVLLDGGAACWGENRSGSLGDGTRERRSAPVRVVGLESVGEIAAGDGFSCALQASGQAYCWGSNAFGQLGDGTSEDAWSPVSVSGARRFAAIRSGGAHACALDPGGAAFCWGWNARGQTGSVGPPEQRTPVRVKDDLLFRQLSAGRVHSCGVDQLGRAFCWGANAGRALGDPQVTESWSVSPVLVKGGLRFAWIEAGWGTWSCGVVHTGELACWGTSRDGVFGSDGEVRLDGATPLPLGLWSALSAGGEHLCGTAMDDDRVLCWGRGGAGQLGDGVRRGRNSPTPAGS